MKAEEQVKQTESQSQVAWTQHLLDWYDVHKRELPWRESKDPYRIWVSEVMSQQTRIEAMRPYFENWVLQFPTLESLASAEEDTVVRAWQGLGYYSRARNLHQGVKEVVETYGGQVPRTRKEMESLKGVGSYTAGAVLSIAYNLREPAVDGNVLRVYARLYNIHEDILGTVGKKVITTLVEDTMPYDRPGDFNEALMDFGASICIPKIPRCESCPLVQDCKAKAEGTEQVLPIRIKKTKVQAVQLYVGIIKTLEGYYVLHRRPKEGLLQGMWEFPSVEGGTATSRKTALTEVLQDIGITVTMERPMVKEVTHTFSHRKWTMKGYRGVATEVTIDRSNTIVLEGDESVQQAVAQGQIIPLRNDWILCRKEAFHVLPWAGPHGKFIDLC